MGVKYLTIRRSRLKDWFIIIVGIHEVKVPEVSQGKRAITIDIKSAQLGDSHITMVHKRIN